jgi:TolA-binding protein
MALKSLTLLLLASISLLVSAQTKTGASTDFASNQASKKELSALRVEVTTLEENLKDLAAKLGSDEYLLSQKQDRQDTLVLTLTDHTFQRLDTDTGFFLISVQEVTPYLNGYKLSLNIGNPMAAKYSGAKVKLTWNTFYDARNYTEASFKEWQKNKQEKEVVLPSTLLPGTWNSIEVILAPATTDQLGDVTFAMSTDTVFLSTE